MRNKYLRLVMMLFLAVFTNAVQGRDFFGVNYRGDSIWYNDVEKTFVRHFYAISRDEERDTAIWLNDMWEAIDGTDFYITITYEYYGTLWAGNLSDIKDSIGSRLYVKDEYGDTLWYDAVGKGFVYAYYAVDENNDTTWYQNAKNASSYTAYNFSVVNDDGDTIWYDITSEEDKTCAVTRGQGYNPLRYKGEIIIPQEVTNGNVTYLVTGIENGAFEECSQLTKVSIPSTVTYIGSDAFYECRNLTDIGELPTGLQSIGSYAFESTSISSVTIPASVKSIDAAPFYGCVNLTELTVEEGNEYFCAIDNVLFNKDTTKLIQYAAGLKAESYIIPESVEKIGYYAFSDCKSLVDVTLPSSLTEIGTGAFYYDTLLASITIPATVYYVSYYSFYGCTNLQEIKVEDGNANYVDIDGVLYTNDKETLVCYPAGKKDTEYKLDEACKEIRTVASSWNRYLTNIILPEGLEEIEYGSFFNCTALKELYIPASVKTISGGSVFEGCTSLESLTVDANNETYMSEDNVLFDKEMTGLIAFAANNDVESYVIPETVTFIENEAFAYARNLRKVVIPASVTDIGYEAFLFDAEINVIDTIVCKSSEPLDVDDEDIFGEDNAKDSLYNHTILVVPDGSVNAYQKTAPWSNFKNIMSESDVTGIKEVNADNTPASATADEKIYDLQGRRLYMKPEKGLYIKGGKKYLDN